MSRNVLFGIGVALWAVIVFFATFYLTFPSDALVARIEKEAPSVLGRDYEVDLASAAPWWVGVSMSDVMISQKPSRRARLGEDQENTPVAFVSKAWVRTNLFSLIARTPSVIGAVRLGDGEVDFDVRTRVGNQQPIEVATVEVEANALPLADLVGSPLVSASLGGFSMVGSGAVDLDVDLTAGERGMADGHGRIALSGRDLMLAEIASDTTGPLGIDVPIKELDIVAEVDEGKGEVERGVIDSDLFRLEISGEFGLRDPLSNSTINLELKLSDISKDLSLVETMLRTGLGATPDDGAYTFTCRGMVARLNSRSCRADGGRRAGGRPSVRRPGRPPRQTGRRNPATFRRPDADDERARRREEIRERLRARAAGGPDDVDEEEEEPLDDLDEVVDEYEDEEVLDDEEYDDYEEE